MLITVHNFNEHWITKSYRVFVSMNESLLKISTHCHMMIANFNAMLLIDIRHISSFIAIVNPIHISKGLEIKSFD